jgi:hypothetical protein
MKQTRFASAPWEKKGKVTRRERFLAEMDAVIPWQRLLALIEPRYPKAGKGRQPHPMERMLRIHFMQNWFNLNAFALANPYLLRRRLLPRQWCLSCTGRNEKRPNIRRLNTWD